MAGEIGFEMLEGLQRAWIAPPPRKPPIVALDMDEDEEHRRQIGLLIGQIIGPITEVVDLPYICAK
jgi:hypothetical protein